MLTRLEKKMLPFLTDYRERNEVQKLADKLNTFAEFFEYAKAATLEDASNLDGFIGVMKNNLSRIRTDLNTFEDIIREYEEKRKPKDKKI